MQSQPVLTINGTATSNARLLTGQHALTQSHTPFQSAASMKDWIGDKSLANQSWVSSGVVLGVDVALHLGTFGVILHHMCSSSYGVIIQKESVEGYDL